MGLTLQLYTKKCKLKDVFSAFRKVILKDNQELNQGLWLSSTKGAIPVNTSSGTRISFPLIV
ncbi:MAG: hypothetical protein EA361_02185, partial [Bacteroidetes bacterium]